MRFNDETINCSFDNESALYRAYMPFVNGGGIFVRSKQAYEFGSHVKLIVQLFDESVPYDVEGKVIWITPKSAQGSKPAGVGLQFLGEGSKPLCNKIEIYLAGMLKSTQPTDTI